MTIGPSENALNSQLVAQLQAGEQSRVQRPQQAQPVDQAARTANNAAFGRDVARQGGRAPANRDPSGDVDTRSTQRRDLVLRTPDPQFSDATAVSETEDRVARLFQREAPTGRTSAQQDQAPPERLGQIVDIRV